MGDLVRLSREMMGAKPVLIWRGLDRERLGGEGGDGEGDR
jgi:hypothetical protein